MQHGPRRKAHHGYHAGGSARELPEEELPGGLRRLLRSQHIVARAKTGQRNFERNREPGEANPWTDQASSQFSRTFGPHSSGSARSARRGLAIALGGTGITHSADSGFVTPGRHVRPR